MSEAKVKKPPRVAEALLKLLFPDDYAYCTIGDLREVHRSLVLEYGSLYASGWYWLQLIQAIPAYIGNTVYWTFTLIKSNLKIAFRSLAKNKLSSSINIVGLSIAIGCCITIFAFINFQNTMDDFHVNGDRIYLIESVINRQGKEQIWGHSPLPIGPALKSDLPQVEEVVRVSDRNAAIMRFKDNVYNESVRFVGPTFFDMFSFPILRGEKNALRSTDAVMISEEIAHKYFRGENPIGKQITLTMHSNYKKNYFVRAVFETLPNASSLRFEVLLAFEEQFNIGAKKRGDWNQRTNTFVMLDKENNIASVEGSMGKYLVLQNASNNDWKGENFIFDSLTEMFLNRWKVRGGISIGVHPAGMIVLSLMCLFMISLACFNYINIAIASAARRLKEIGVRKVVGGKKIQLVGQFMTENLLTCIFAAAMGLILAEMIFVPAFNSLQTDPILMISTDLASNMNVWAFVIVLILFTSICAGIYPAFYVASFRPIDIFRGNEKFGRRSLLSKLLLTAQFTLSFIAIFFAVTTVLNGEYQRSIDWGYNKSQIMFFRVNSDREYTALKTELSKNSDILAITGGLNHLGHSSSIKVSEIRHKKYEIRFFRVAPNYLDVMEVKQSIGRAFDDKTTGDVSNSLVVNETFVKNVGLDEPLQQNIKIDSTLYTIVGVVKDFHHQSFYYEIKPVAFALTKEDNFRYLVAKIAAGKVVATADYAKSTWKRLFPDKPYTAFFQDDMFAEHFSVNESSVKCTMAVAIIITILSCMGLFGLVSLNVTRRLKEFSVRKILGANLLHIAKLVQREFIGLLAAASIVSAPISYFLVSLLFNTIYKYSMEFTSLPFIITSGALFLTAILTVSSQMNRVISVNPVDILRTE